MPSSANTFEGTCSRKNIDLKLLLAEKELFVNADMDQIQQVLYNLLDNAIKFSNDNSSINIETTVKNGKVFVSIKDKHRFLRSHDLKGLSSRFQKNYGWNASAST